MHITVTDTDGEVFVLDVSEDLELENFKALCSYESRIPAVEMNVVYDGRPLLDAKKPLNSFGVKNGDMIFIQRKQAMARTSNMSSRIPNTGHNALPPPQFPDFSSIQIPGSSRSGAAPSHRQGQAPMSEKDPNFPQFLRDQLLKHPDQIVMLKQNNPRLAEALESGDLKKFSQVLEEQQKQRREREMQRIRVMNADPFDLEAQKLIAEEIRQQNVDQNMEHALEHAPESFGQVIMLYIKCFVNHHPVKAFVDSGAQTTIMSRACAERCCIMRLVDTRWKGIAKGVGEQTIIGRVHLGQIQIGNDFLPSSFSILEEQPMDMLLGLDMLRRHQCCIDLKNNVLLIGTTGTTTSFLHESELPECAKLNRVSDDAVHMDGQEEEDKQLAAALSESAATTSSGSGGTNSRAFPASDVEQLVSMGFNKEQAIQGLTSAQGDVNKAAAILLAKAMPLPR